MSDDHFHLFPQLPVELRDEIWGWCLPRRVRELDYAARWEVFKDPAPLCFDRATTRRNCLPPLITRVCRESRAVALKTRLGKVFPWDDISSPAYWEAGTEITGRYAWRDGPWDTPHLNWNDALGDTYLGSSPRDGSPLGRLAYESSQSSGRGSLTLPYFEEGRTIWARRLRRSDPPTRKRQLDPQQIRDMEALRQLPHWSVVMHIIIIHIDFDSAVSTGLFGLFGDERVRVVHMADKAKCEAYYRLAEACERQSAGKLTVPQGCTRRSLDTMQERLKQVMHNAFDCDEITARMHPAIMFRLCEDMCNERSLEDDRKM